MARTRVQHQGGAMLNSIDHVVIAVCDLEAARKQYVTLLGRSPSWLGSHPSFGTRNVIFRLENTYIELLSPAAPAGDSAIADGLRERLAERGDGLHLIALGTDDADEAARTLRARGLSPSEPVAGLAQDEPSGAFRRFKNVFLPPAETGGIGLFVIEHLSDEDELPPALPIGDEHGDETGVVRSLDHVVVLTQDPERAKSLYGEKLGLRLALDKTFEKRRTRLLFFRTGSCTLEVGASLDTMVEPGAPPAEPDRLWGLAFQVPDADRARDRLLAEGLEVSTVRNGNKAGTRVFSVKGDPLGVPTLIIEPVQTDGAR
jgi:catechol 2,3-dioxygenase-like lactoylglutathione lyase family enzyme